MIRIDGLSKRIAGAVVLDDVSLEIPRGQIVALIGPSGTGKSVLLKHLVGLLLPDAGDVQIDGASIVRARGRALSALQRRIGYVFQDAALLDSLTVEENLRLALSDAFCAKHPDSCRQQISAALRAVNLDDDIVGRLPGELSGGMRKRVGVARALIHWPDILLYDEPTTGLDPQNTLAINEVIVQSRQRQATSLVVTHDLGSIPRYADRVVLLERGRFRFDGPPADLWSGADATLHAFTRSMQERS